MSENAAGPEGRGSSSDQRGPAFKGCDADFRHSEIVFDVRYHVSGDEGGIVPDDRAVEDDEVRIVGGDDRGYAASVDFCKFFGKFTAERAADFGSLENLAGGNAAFCQTAAVCFCGMPG